MGVLRTPGNRAGATTARGIAIKKRILCQLFHLLHFEVATNVAAMLPHFQNTSYIVLKGISRYFPKFASSWHMKSSATDVSGCKIHFLIMFRTNLISYSNRRCRNPAYLTCSYSSNSGIRPSKPPLSGIVWLLTQCAAHASFCAQGRIWAPKYLALHFGKKFLGQLAFIRPENGFSKPC